MTHSPSNSTDSVWSYKPGWCQPWSILLTGIVIVGGSWLLFHRIWLATALAIPVSVWWIVFLGIYPRMAADSGLLDEYRRMAARETE